MTNPRPVQFVPSSDPIAATGACVDALQVLDERSDVEGDFPVDSIELLAEAGLLVAPFPAAMGGAAIGSDPATTTTLRTILTMIGNASLVVGRIYEGHVNAILLATRHGGDGILAALLAEARAGRISGVWNAGTATGLRLTRGDGEWRLDGEKVYCSGAGSIRRPVVTAAVAPGAPPLMLVPDTTAAGVVVDLAGWRASGMRGSATGTVRFRNVMVADTATIGEFGDYYGSPGFAAGAWRVLAVQLGALERVLSLHAIALCTSGRDGDPVQRARFADAAADVELARLLVTAAASHAEDRGVAPIEAENYVNMARTAFERLALGVIAATRRNVGLTSYIAPNPVDRVLRDIETYLRQPFLDASRDSYARYLLDLARPA